MMPDPYWLTYANFTRTCTVCGSTVTVANGHEHPHRCRIEIIRGSQGGPLPEPLSRELVAALAEVPILEYDRSRDHVLFVPRGAFIDAPKTPALIMHPLNAQVFRVATERTAGTGDIGVQIEGAARYIVARAEAQARVANRRLDRLVEEAKWRQEMRWLWWTPERFVS